MDWRDTPEQATWRSEVRTFLGTELPDEFRRQEVTADELIELRKGGQDGPRVLEKARFGRSPAASY